MKDWLIVMLLVTLILCATDKRACSEEHLTGDNVLLRAVLQEAESEPLDGMVAVAGVALDRAADRRWPGTPRDVLLQPAQFEGMSRPLRNHSARARALAEQAVLLAVSGHRPCGTVLYFHAEWMTPSWDFEKIQPACQIGGHVFYTDR
jgi:N-acetylmuramoyl-L-alanine amidase